MIESKQAKQHALLLSEIQDCANRAALKREPLPDDLIKQVLEADGCKPFFYLMKRLTEKKGEIATSLPLQNLVLAKAEEGFEDKLADYIRLYPFNGDLHLRLWRILATSPRLRSFYIDRHPFVDRVLDLFWAKAGEIERVFYIVCQEVSKEMGLKVWHDVEKDKSLLNYSRLYLAEHPVPKGLLALIVKESTKGYDMSDLIEYSTHPFYPEDEVVLVSQELQIFRFYIEKFKRLSAEAQIALLNSGDEIKILSYAEKVGVWDEKAQNLIVSQVGPLTAHPDWVVFIAQTLAEPFNAYTRPALCEIISR